MVNAVNGPGQGHYISAFSQPNQTSATGETTEAVEEPSHPGKGKAGAPGQIAKQMLGGTPPAEFALGNLVSLIAHGDMEGAQNLVNSLTAPPAEEPETGGDVAGVITEPEVSDPVAVLPVSDETVIEVTEAAGTAEETGATVGEAIILSPDTDSETSLLDLFDSAADDEETV